MKITYNNQTIDFYNFRIASRQILVSLSGGCDSAAAAFLTCKHFPGITLIPYTARDQNAPKDADAAEQIVKWLQSRFPKTNIHNLQIFEFNDRTEDFVSFKECKRAIKGTKRFNKLNKTQVSKILQLDKISQSMINQHPNAVRLDGMTLNPPIEDMKKLGFYKIAERRRDKEEEERPQLLIGINNNIIYQPWANVDKKFVADIFKKNNLMDTLFPLTRSCVGTAKQTDNFTRECHSCFWCWEKKWAFDLEWSDK